MMTRHQYVTTYNTGAASWGFWASYFGAPKRDELERVGQRLELPKPGPSGSRIVFAGSDCIDDGRFWGEGYISDGEKWSFSEGFSDRSRAKAWFSSGITD